MLSVHHTFTSALVDLLTKKVCHVFLYSRCKFPPSLKLIRPSVAYSVLAADTLRDLVILTFDLSTSISGNTWRARDQLSTKFEAPTANCS